MTVDIFQYSNIYTLERSFQWLADDPNVKEECGPYVTLPCPFLRDRCDISPTKLTVSLVGFDSPDWSHLLFLYSRLKPGKTVFEWEEEHNVRAQGIDVRRFMSFGVIKVTMTISMPWSILKIPPGVLATNPPLAHSHARKASRNSRKRRFC